MMRYTLRCADGHGFESWFAGSEAYDTLRRRGLVTCPDCGSADVDKALMAPRVSTGRAARPASPDVPPAAPPAPPGAGGPGGGRGIAISKAEAALAELRAKIEATTDYVGPRFADEARAMHEGRMDHRPIWGETTAAERRKLAEDGIPAMPLPFGPRAKSN